MRVFPYDRVPDGSTVLATNLFTNPNLVGDGTWAEVRRNMCRNPMAVSGGTGWQVTSGATATGSYETEPEGTFYRATATTTSSTVGVTSSLCKTGSITIGESFRIALEIRTSADLAAGWVLDCRQTGVATAFATTSTPFLPANTWVKFEITIIATNATTSDVQVRTSVSRSVGQTFDLKNVYLTRTTSTTDEFFNPDAPLGSIDPDMRQRWLGTPNASESVMEIERVRGLGTSNCIAGVSTREGKPAMRLIPTGASSDSYVQVAVPASARSTGTLIGTSHIDAPLIGSRVSDRKLEVWVPAQSTPIPANAAGAYPQRLSFTGLTSSYVARWRHGGSLGSGDVWWTDIGLFAGNYDGPAFSGDTPDDGDIFHEWSGVANSSTSERSLRNFLPVASDLTPHTLIEVDDLDPGVSFITLWRDDGSRWQEVRGAVMAPVAGSWAGVDWECGFNRATAYRVEQFDAAGLSLGFLPAVTVTLTSQETWVQNVMAPRAGTPVMWTDSALRDIDRPTDSEVVWARGATYGTAVGSARRGIVGVNLEMVTDTLEHADRVQALLGSPGNELPPVLCVRKGAGEGFARIPATLFVHVGSINEVDFTVRFGGENVVHQTSGTEVRPPAKKLGTPLLTLADLDAFYATLGAIDADNLTLGDIDRRWDLAGYATV